MLIDTFNHERFIRSAVDSVLQQEFDSNQLEIVVVDDGSSDDTPNILKSYGERIRFIAKENGGQASAFNVGVPMCQGDIICLLDGDDWWSPKKVRTIMDGFSANPSLVAIGHGIIVEDQVANRTDYLRPDTSMVLQFTSKNDVAKFRKNMCFLGTSRLSMRREVALALLPVPNELIFEADEHFFTLLPAIGNVAILAEELTHYRIHGGNLYQDSRLAEGQGIQDLRRLKVRARVFDVLANSLPPLLAKHGCRHELIPLLTAPVSNEARRLRLSLGEGTRSEAMKTEWIEYKLRRSHGSGQMIALALARVACAGILPPKKFYSLKQAYSGSRLRHAVSWIDGKLRHKKN